MKLSKDQFRTVIGSRTPDKNMKRFAFFFSMMIVMTLTGCDNNDLDVTYNTKEDSEEFIIPHTVLSMESYSPDDFCDRVHSNKYMQNQLGDNEIANKIFFGAIKTLVELRKPQMDKTFAKQSANNSGWQVQTCTFSYESVSVSGKPITLSGRITFPNAKDGSGHKVKSLSLYVHYFLDRDVVPSLSLSPVDLRYLFDSAVIEPDLEGYGTSEDRPYCGFSMLAQARQTADCMLAAIEILKDNGVELIEGGHTTGWGYSLGGPIVLEFARYYDKQLSASQRKKINLTSVYSGGGPFLLDRMIELLNVDKNLYARTLRYLPHFLSSIPEEQLGGYQLRDFFPTWMHETKVTIDGETMSFFESVVNNKSFCGSWPSELGLNQDVLYNHFAADMFTAESSLDLSHPKTVALLNAIKKQFDWADWTTSADIYLTHDPNDKNIPYQQTQELYEQLKPSGRVFWRKTSAGPLGLIWEAHPASTLMSCIYAILYEEPQEAFRRGF